VRAAPASPCPLGCAARIPGLEVGTSDGHTQQWGAGEAFMPDDLRGKGYTTSTIGGPVRALYIPLPQDFDVQRWG